MNPADRTNSVGDRAAGQERGVSQQGFGPVARCALLALAALSVLWVRIQPASLASATAPAQYRIRGGDGREHAVFVDADSFLWLRHARNYLRSGTTCDAITDGVCRDTLANAPVGRPMLYARSLHILAIVAVHRLVNIFAPGYPLEASAYWVVVLVGMLGVLPAFALGRRVGGDIGGLAAAILIGVNPFFLTRSVGGDDDVWNLVLPLFTFWGVSIAISDASTRRRLGGTLLAAGAVGADAATWSGWVFSWSVALGVFSADVLRRGLIQRLRRRRPSVPDRRDFGLAFLLLLVFFEASGVLVSLVHPEAGYFSSAGEALRHGKALVFGAPATVDAEAYWPSAFNTVTELEHLRFGDIAALASGQEAYFVAAVLGILSLWLLRRGRRAHFTGALLLTIWFVAALLQARQGNRFILLLVAPAGLGCAAALGGVSDGLGKLIARFAPNARPALSPLLFALLSLPVVAAVAQATGFARSMIPPLSGAWWNALTQIREATPADAIIDTSWDFGHAAKYVAERRVSADGASLRTHAPYWFARALLTQNEREAVGLLRMLNCGSDATPDPEGRFGAYGKLRAHGMDDLAALSTVVALSVLEQPAARDYLRAHGLSEENADDVLASTHCASPPAYLVLTSQLNLSKLWTIAAWDFQRAYVVNVARYQPQPAAISDLERRFGTTADRAATLYTQASSLKTADAAWNFIVPPQEYLLNQWRDCPGDGTDCGPALLHRQVPDAYPTQVLVAGADRVVQMMLRDSRDDGLVGLVDDARHQFVLGTHYLMHSTFVRLMYLDGRYSHYFEKFDERNDPNGERVVTWRIRDEPQPLGR